jgi:hypothetical protein
MNKVTIDWVHGRTWGIYVDGKLVTMTMKGRKHAEKLAEKLQNEIEKENSEQ